MKRLIWPGLVVAVAAAGVLFLFPRDYRAAVQDYRLTDVPREIVLHASLAPGDIGVGSEVLHEDAGTPLTADAPGPSEAGFYDLREINIAQEGSHGSIMAVHRIVEVRAR